VDGGDGHVFDIQAEKDRGDQSPLRHASPHATAGRGGRLEGRFERPTSQVG
jgi:hypothetical protein